MPEGIAGAPKRRKAAEMQRLLDVPVIQHQGMKAPAYQLMLDEMRVQNWQPRTVTELRKSLGWQEATVQRLLLNNVDFFKVTTEGWIATANGRDAWATWKQQVYNAKGMEP